MNLSGNCEVDFKNWALEKYGYSDIYYLGFPVVFEFFDQFLDWELPKGNHAIGEMKERILIAKMTETIKLMNQVYNENHDKIKQL
jgi:hypothetical protein